MNVRGLADGVGAPLCADTDGLLSQALLLGELRPAVELCLREERFADAIILAQAGGAELLRWTQEHYLAKRRTKISPVLSIMQEKKGGGLPGSGQAEAIHALGLVFRTHLCPCSKDLYFMASPVECSDMSGFIGTSLCVTPTDCAGWKAEGLFPFLPSTASSLCCKEELERPSMCLQPEELERGTGFAADIFRAREVP